MLSPEHLRYLARQLKLIKIFKETREDFEVLEDEDEDEDESTMTVELDDEEENIMAVVDDEVGERQWAKLTALVDKLVGEKLLKSLDEGNNMDCSELTYPDKEIVAEN